MDCIIASHISSSQRLDWLGLAIESAMPHCEKVIVSVSGEYYPVLYPDNVVVHYSDRKLAQFDHIKNSLKSVSSSTVIFLDDDDLLLPNTHDEVLPYLGFNSVGHQYGFQDEHPSIFKESWIERYKYSYTDLVELLPLDMVDRDLVSKSLQYQIPYYTQDERLNMFLKNYNNRRFLPIYDYLSPHMILYSIDKNINQVRSHVSILSDFSGTICTTDYLAEYIEEVGDEEFGGQEDINFMSSMKVLTKNPYVYRRFHNLERDYK